MAAHPPGLPGRLLRRETVYRHFRGASRQMVMGCGFLLKPDRTGWHVDHQRDEYSGVLVLRGSGTYIDRDGSEIPLSPGSFFQRLPGRRHSTVHETDGSWAECFVALGRELFEAMAALGCAAPDRPVLTPGSAPALAERFEAILDDLALAGQGDLAGLLLRVQGLLLEVLELDRRGGRPDPHAAAVERACRLLGADLPRRLSMPAVAARMGMGYERFRKVFRERTGVSPGDYRIRRRLERARAMLAAGEMSVKEVAYALGYPDAFVFSRQFAKFAGSPPSRFLRAP